MAAGDVILAQKGNDQLIYAGGTIYWDGQGIGRTPLSNLMNQTPDQGLSFYLALATLVIQAIGAFYLTAASGCSYREVNFRLSQVAGALLSLNIPLLKMAMPPLLSCLMKGLSIQPGSLVFVDDTGTFIFTNPLGNELGRPNSAPSASPTGGIGRIEAIDAGGYLVAQDDISTVYDSAFAVVGTQTLDADAAGSNHADGFYVWEHTTALLRRISALNGVVDSWTVSVAGAGRLSLAVSPDNSTAYAGRNGTNVVTAYTLGGGSATFAEREVADQVASAYPAIITLRNGHVLIGWQVGDGGPFEVVRYSAAGSVLATYPISGEFLIALCPALDDLSFWWSQWNGSVAVIEQIRLTDGATLNSFQKSTAGGFAWDNAAMAVVPVLAP